MKVIYNTIIPFPGYKAINLFGILFARKNSRIDDVTINHESIHSAQMAELLWIPFYLWYVIEWFVKLLVYGSDAYYNISFEREAYANEFNKDYLKTRRPYSFFRYLNKFN